MQEGAWERAIAAYRSNNFEKTIEEINQIEKLRDEQELYKGLSLLFKQSAQPKMALKIFEKILSDSSSNYHDIAMWYAALTCRELNMNKKSNKYLITIVESQSWMHVEAQDILNQD